MAKDIILVAILTTLVLLWTETVECTLWDFYSKEHILRGGVQRGDPNCPVQPIPVALPNPLPSGIQDALSKLESLMQSTLNNDTLPAITASLVYREQVLFSKGVGMVSKKQPTTPPQGDTIFRIGSVSKVFATLVVFQLFERGYISSLDDPLDKYIPKFVIKNPFSKEGITIRQMVGQMSGLPREAPCGLFPGQLNICPVTSDTILEHLSTMQLIRPPWTRPSYSNLAYSLLGRLLVEEKFFPEMKYEEYVQQNILTPLGMKRTGFNFTQSVISEMAVGYLVNGEVAPLTDLGWNRPCGQMYSTVEDLNKLAMFFYEAYNQSFFPKSNLPFSYVLSAVLRREMGLPVFWNPDGLTQFGTPFEIQTENNYSIRTKGGNVGGYSASFSYVPELQLGLNVLFSGAIDGFTFTANAYDILLPAFHSALLANQPPIPQPPSSDPYVGTYTSTSAGITAVVVEANNTLVVVFTVYSVYLAYSGEEGVFQLFAPPELLPCMTAELLGVTGEWVYFGTLKSGVYNTVTVPGFLYGTELTRSK